MAETSDKKFPENKRYEQDRRMYLLGKGINPSKPQQLDLLFPSLIGEREDLRHIPNDYARSALFSVKKKGAKREALVRKQLFHFSKDVEIIFTGIELSAADDELVWQQIINYGSHTNFGEPFIFNLSQLVKDIGISKGGKAYQQVRECISRLKASEVLIKNNKVRGKSVGLSLIESYETINDDKGKPEQYRVWINPLMVALFAGDTFTSHSWQIYRKLSPTARKLADYVCSHRTPNPLSLEKFRLLCVSAATPQSWKKQVDRVVKELEGYPTILNIFVSNGHIHCIRDKKDCG